MMVTQRRTGRVPDLEDARAHMCAHTLLSWLTEWRQPKDTVRKYTGN